MTDLQNRRRAYLKCRERNYHRAAIEKTAVGWHVCTDCGTEYRFESKVVERRVPGRTLCVLAHHKGVACPNEPECIWGG